MWIVRLALRRPYTFVVMAFAILLFGIVAIYRMPADVFPDINIPVVSAIWTYSGVDPDEMADVVTTRSERSFTTGVNDVSTSNRNRLPAFPSSAFFSIRTRRSKPASRR